MLITVIPTPFFSANAMVILPDDGEEALIVDPSHGVIDQIEQVLESNSVSVGAVLCTHGHPDHVWDSAQASRLTHTDFSAPVWLPGPDIKRMDDPLSYMPIPVPDLDLHWEKPADIREFPAGDFKVLDGLIMRMIPAPGHTEGSAVFLGSSTLTVKRGGAVAIKSESPVPWALTGDVIFAGSVGRTDLPGGDETQMRHSLRTLSNAIDPATFFIPGHGPFTKLAVEMETNPYLIRARRIG